MLLARTSARTRSSLRQNASAEGERQKIKTPQKFSGGTYLKGGRIATVSVTGRLLLLDVINMKRT
jgi:hypothetical protein